ncbi:LacI family DNA-binding transcriptional regulator [Geochorda subterranea]|uniref:LacI family DNA-binding transcriptional regulator n=1 Tax=Geochorda subterranea TaxID=3109564 RepID=A0ABZ1BRJ0_9FIRM|nr:LacI family DNA-binding transcriptional regulator [Limnochorda sp. LNt]WRP15076.1 LacI family DNA-binding transcriptional regulator [Limnochorda sp. LNt]
MHPNMADVARVAGVSKSTVSRALAGDPRVSPATRRRVEAAARQLGYTPHGVARALARGRTSMVAVAAPSPPRSFSDPFFLDFLGAVGDGLTAAGYNLVLTVSDDGRRSGRGSLRELVVGRMVDAVLVTEVQVADARLDLVLEQGLPCVALGSPDRADVYAVDGDNVVGTVMAVRHLVEMGHRHVACVAGPSHLTAARQRLRGFMQAMQEAGLEVPAYRLAEGDFTLTGGQAATRRLLEAERAACGEVRLTALFASNDLMAMGAVAALRASGLHVPGDVSVVGFDGVSLARMVDPPLTTVAQPVRQLGSVAVEMLLEQLMPAPGASGATPAGPRQVVLPCTLKPGGSTAPMRGRRAATPDTA